MTHDWWADIQQVATVTTGAVSAVALGLAARFGKHLRDRTGELRDRTAELADQTREANEHAKAAAAREEKAFLRPSLSVVVVVEPGDVYGWLYVLHCPESNTDALTALSVSIGEAFDVGDGRQGKRPPRGPWRFTDGSDTYGWSPWPWGELKSGSSTRWKLSRQMDDTGSLGGLPWDNPRIHGPVDSYNGGFLVRLTATSKVAEWRYSVLVTQAGEEFRV